jgi:PKD domain
VSAVQFSADPTFPCPKLGVCGSPFTSDAVVTLRPGSDGLRSVYARVFDSQAPGGGDDVIGLRDGSFGLPPGNMSEVASASIVLDTTGPKLVVSRSPEPQKAGQPVSFDGSQSVDNGGFNADSGVDAGTAVWDFGDGTKGSGLATTHVYAAAGSYKATLSLRDRVGNQSTLTVPVTIMPSNWGGTGTPTQTVGTPTSAPTQADPPLPR